MSIRRKRAEYALGPSRLLGVQGIRQVSNPVTTFSNSATSITTGNYPTPEPGDVILAISFNSLSATTLTVTSSGLTFTEIGTITSGSVTMSASYAVSPDSTARDVTVTSSGSASNMATVVVVLRGCYTYALVDTSGSSGTLTASTTLTVPSFDTTHDGAWAYAAVASADDNSLTCVQSGWTNRATINPSTSRGFSVGSAYRPTAGATGTIDFSETVNGPDAGVWFTFSLRPIPG